MYGQVGVHIWDISVCGNKEIVIKFNRS